MKIAIVEDDINMRKSLEIAMSDYQEFEIKTFKNAKDALKNIDDSFDLVITDINMPGMDGIEFVKALDGKYEVIIMTGNATLQRAIESIHLGVKDFLLKPFDVDTLITAIRREDRIQKVKKTLTKRSDKKSISGFFGNSKALEGVLNIANKASKTDATILLLGESGVGKELFASYVHENSPRAKKPFIAINMAAIPENLIESELFGFEKGAFTDAAEAKAGQFELAEGGTLFLDEIGEMPYSVQAKLLRALQEKEIRRLGSSKSTKINVRVVSATNANLLDKIKNGEFRDDLYYRLNTIPINIPPLRERRDEILQIADKILEQNCKRYNFELKNFSDESKKQLLSYRWPGNIRELISVVERAVILSEGNEITPNELFLEHRGLSTQKDISSLERELIAEVLNSKNGDVDKTSEILGMSKENLIKKIKNYQL
ncbi:MAG: AAA family ATPase [Sulfurimonas sp. RIFOXYD12_FULL_33_39]|uniref:sigma-54-dependent transcriptional regulator n=1 Tax=unclassified Sulfurimonas TaxID=2623549 RepID=UPI0008B7997D|nr:MULTISPECIES: sigma-54 dependent transcriptional regulator [unclassified Sulfurimonas]OHE07328.1 MAG: AAA family ATPase [Sulfurimonas sp. RIFCSPLOWO2_12_FULL_34_6]OHE10691.1 MAG: AAA family ATPase [Sulfurimonas sp. RIFOXYD12_FULL_33_39]OHE13204.1 MAG: AAA family ATPase [Sulfurimonas sp. RIFOXYD2_FULL_34_21]DAB27450.1 MAG TPA: AAA family ATPase [Sulfurimonas sp. UBA10385]